MANLVSSMAALISKLDSYVTNILSGSVLHLYQNNYTPVIGSAVGNFTESTFTSYSSFTLSAWGASYDNGSNQAETDHPAHVFSCTGGAAENIYGYYITKGGVYVYGQRLSTPAPPFVISSGLTFTVTPEYMEANL